MNALYVIHKYFEIKEGKKTSTLKMKEPKFVQGAKEAYVITPEKDTYVNDMRL